MGVALINILPLHPPLIIQGRVDFESDDDDDALESPTESDSEDEYMDEYSYDSPSSDSGGSVDKELNPFKVAKKQLSLGLFSKYVPSISQPCFPAFSFHQIVNLSTALFSHCFKQGWKCTAQPLTSLVHKFVTWQIGAMRCFGKQAWNRL